MSAGSRARCHRTGAPRLWRVGGGQHLLIEYPRRLGTPAFRLERREPTETSQEELVELTDLCAVKGLSHELAAEVELGIDPGNLTSPWRAAFASFVAFALGALLPLAAIAVPPPHLRVPVTVVAVLTALALTGVTAARLGEAPLARPFWRNVIGGMVALAVTYGIGTLVGHAV